MNCSIDAWLENGAARLRIVDADSGRVRLEWSFAEAARRGACASCNPLDDGARAALDELMNGFFLLACADAVRSGRAPVRCPLAAAEAEPPMLRITASAA